MDSPGKMVGPAWPRPVSEDWEREDVGSGHRAAVVDVCIANPWFWPVLVGPGERFRRYGPGLRSRGVSLRVFTVKHDGLPERETIDGIGIERVSVKKGVRWRQRTTVYRLLSRLLRPSDRPDVIQFLSPNQWYVPFVVLCKLLRVPTFLVFTLLSEGSRPWIPAFVRRLYRRVLFEGFDCVVTSSHVMTDELRSMRLRFPRVETIPNGVDVGRFQPPVSEEERENLRHDLGLRARGRVIVFVGGMYPRKGVDVLLEAWHQVIHGFPEATLLMVGPRPDAESKHGEFVAHLNRLKQALPDPDRVVFVGPVRNVEEYLQIADGFVFPSRREGMPNVVPEAMASGLPCVLTPFHGLPEEFGRPGLEYLLVPRTVDGLRGGLTKIMEDPERARELGNRAREWVCDHLALDDTLDRYARLYHELVGMSASE